MVPGVSYGTTSHPNGETPTTTYSYNSSPEKTGRYIPPVAKEPVNVRHRNGRTEWLHPTKGWRK